MNRRFTSVLAALALVTACSSDDQQEGGDTAGNGGGGGDATAGSSQQAGGGNGTAGSKAGGAGVGGDDGGASSGGKGGGNATGGSSGASDQGGSAGAAGDGGSGGQLTTPEALMPIVTAYCAAARACCQGEADMDLEDCEADFGMKNATVGSLSRGAVTLDGAGLEACRAAYVAAETSCEMNGVLAACRGLVHGTVADGAACHSGSECAASPAPNTCHITEQNGTVGICKPTPHAQVGEECVATARLGELYASTTYGAADSLLAMCFEDEGTYCDYDTTPAKCQALRATGADCDDDAQCGSDSYCDYGGDGKCKKRSKLNEACGLCIPQLSCINGTCKSPSFAAGNTCFGYSLGPY